MRGFAYNDLLRLARRYSRRGDEAEDLLQDALIDAVVAGRSDLADASNRRVSPDGFGLGLYQSGEKPRSLRA